jgi:hypothetical protein
MRRWLIAASGLLTLSALAGCGSPEATRTRGAGPGSDVQNRPEEVRLHEGAVPYWRTPRLIPTPPGSADSRVRVSRNSQR